MIKVFYGNGNCSIEGEIIMVVHIHYEGAIEIDDKSPSEYAIIANERKITVFPFIPNIGTPQQEKVYLDNLFNYSGSFKIISVGTNIGRASVFEVMDYSELINSTAETMTTKSEDLRSSYIVTKKVPKTILLQPYVEGLQADGPEIKYLADGTIYKGEYHYHLDDENQMTGRTHTESSQDLYFKDIDEDGKIIDVLVPYSNPKHLIRGFARKRMNKMKERMKKENVKT